MYHVKLSLSGSNQNVRQSIKTLDRTYVTYAKKLFSTSAQWRAIVANNQFLFETRKRIYMTVNYSAIKLKVSASVQKKKPNKPIDEHVRN